MRNLFFTAILVKTCTRKLWKSQVECCQWDGFFIEMEIAQNESLTRDNPVQFSTKIVFFPMLYGWSIHFVNCMFLYPHSVLVDCVFYFSLFSQEYKSCFSVLLFTPCPPVISKTCKASCLLSCLRTPPSKFVYYKIMYDSMM